MSDIYLQITETPTVVTLSAPVISGALSSTVTVANTVTVALDANSLSALENVTVTVGAAITGTVTVSNFPAFPTTQAVTFSDASLTNTQLRASAVTVGGTVTVGNTVTIAGTVSLGIQQSDDADANIKFIPIGYATVDGGGQLDQWTAVDQLSPLPVYFPSNNPLPAGTAQIGSVTASISNSVTISSLPAISGTVTVGAFSSVSVGSGALLAGGLRFGNVAALSLDGGTGYLQVKVESAPSISGTVTLGAGTAQIGSVTVGNSVTIGSLPAISGTVTANINTFPDATTIGEQIAQGFTNYGSFEVAIGGTANVSGTVTANPSNGSLTTRFGSVTTANTAFATSAVTNANRKYLLIQNVTTASNVITVGIGFTPTTTQGIQLSSGAGLTFEGSYIPTGAVNLLSSVTASCFTILEA